MNPVTLGIIAFSIATVAGNIAVIRSAIDAWKYVSVGSALFGLSFLIALDLLIVALLIECAHA